MNKLFSFFLLSIAIVLGCSEKDDGPNPIFDIKKSDQGFSYNTSFETWNKLKTEHNNSYSFQIEKDTYYDDSDSLNFWPQYEETTMITVQKGRITSRKYENKGLDKNNKHNTTFSESDENVGKNPQGELITIDDIYISCLVALSKYPDESKRFYFTTYDNGIIFTCGYSDPRRKLCSGSSCNHSGVPILKNFRWSE